ncbi:MAG: hypothetical protein GY719_40340 [bacterium]|nr:hypothetical protein [bacterium]
MKSSTPIRIDSELYAAATDVAPMMSRSTTQQISHWARVGRELEASSGVSTTDVARVLRGAKGYDSLNTEEQAVVRAHWAERMTALAGALRLDRKFAAEGRPYLDLDEAGNVVRHDPAPCRRAED